VRAGWPVPAGLLAGLVAGGIWTLAQPDRYRADARVLVRGAGAARILPAVKALAESSLVEQNIAQTLRLAGPPRISAQAGQGGVLEVSAEAGSRDRARQIDAEAVVVLTQKIPQRFGPTGISATVLDPAHPAAQTSPTPTRNLLLLGLIGLAGGVAGAARLSPRRRLSGAPVDRDAGLERRLRARLDAVAKRERALARRAGELAARERRLERKEQALAVPAPSPSPEPEPVEEREPALVEPAPQEVRGQWNIDVLESLVREHGGAHPSRNEEWMTYLFLLREHAGHDGALPRTFDVLVDDVFGELIDATGR
jgi:hypothetical protein